MENSEPLQGFDNAGQGVSQTPDLKAISAWSDPEEVEQRTQARACQARRAVAIATETEP